jgi:uncharacterized protein (DUF2141 family)|tara:strand:+ start:223 stop:645 length:423 start_codon:yes stop_codon:yes gene_type:complete
MKKLYLIFLLLYVSNSYSQSKSSDFTLSIKVGNFKTIKGVLRVCITDKKDDFLKSCIFSKTVVVKDETVSLKIENMEKGNYAVSVYHDENNNDILETTRLFGIPIEPYGFSNNPSMTFGPSFKKSVFKMTSDQNISIRLK